MIGQSLCRSVYEFAAKRRGEGTPDSRRALHRDFWVLLLIPAVLYLLVAFAYPISYMILESVGAPHFTLRHYLKALGVWAYVKVLLNTVKISLETTVLCMLLGFPVAFVLANAGKRVMVVLMGVVLLPFWISGLVRSFAWIILLREGGIVNQVLLGMGVIQTPLRLVYNEAGVLIGMAYVLLPYMVLTMYSVLALIDPNVLRAASSLGASTWKTFRSVYLPLAIPGVSAGGLLVFIHAVGAFVAPALLGGPKQMMMAILVELQIDQVLDWGVGSALGVILLVAVILAAGACLCLLDVEALGMERVGRSRVTVQPEGSRTVGHLDYVAFRREMGGIRGAAEGGETAEAELNAGSAAIGKKAERYVSPRTNYGWILVCVVAGCVFLYLIVPVLLISAMALDESSLFRFPPRRLSLHWFREYFGGPLWMASTVLSLKVAVIVAALATVLGTGAALALSRGRFRGKAAANIFILSPMIVPAIIIAVSVYFVFLKLRLVGTLTGLVLGHTIVALPPVVVLVGASLRKFDESFERAALTLGASRWYAWRRVTFPSILPGLISGALFAFLTSFDEVLIALFLAGTFTPTLPKRIWDSVRFDIDPTVCAVATILVIVSMIVMLVAAGLQGRWRRTADRSGGEMGET